ncbi:hypothetical protein [Clostridium sp. CCUG 7971]|uniref:hypothetical protein n=1 Tax=Clostridium sp. CCUG 7971 TaxID=2811414 RepID=UPI001ABB2FB4|nr:hypothetical protein [Clostridium sp. CCUG 7971]MBO3445282.1 hypothetical protein [Clostridium sp. CCUG 7971]
MTPKQRLYNANSKDYNINTLQYLTKYHKVIKEFENKYHATWNNLNAKKLKKAELISDYIIN